MTNRWIGVTLVGCCLAATPVLAQMPADPTNCGTSGGGAAIPGPMAPPYAPEGPSNDLSLPANIPNAFGCDAPCAPCCPRAYADFAYLAWWFKNPTLPGPIVTSSTSTAATATSGATSDPNTTNLVTDGTLRYRSPFSGGRVTLGYFLDDKQQSAFEATGFIVGQRTANVTVLSNTLGIPTIAQPFTNFQTGTPSALQLALPGTLAGGMTVSSAARLFGGEANFVCNYPDCCVCCIPLPFSFLVGARYLNLDERLDMNGFSQGIGAGTVSFPGVGQPPPANLALPSPATVTSLDSFHTRNQFYGGQLGVRLGWSFGPWFVGGQAKVAAGGVQEQVQIGGNTTLNVPGAIPVTVPGHLYAVASNSGTFSRNQFAYVPEGEVRIGYRFNANFLMYAGYNVLYISKVARPGDQIDTMIDARQVPASATFQQGFIGTRPTAIPIVESTFWAQGVNAGFEITF